MLINLDKSKQMCYNVGLTAHIYNAYPLLDSKQIVAETSLDRDRRNISLFFILFECWNIPIQSYKVYLYSTWNAEKGMDLG